MSEHKSPGYDLTIPENPPRIGMNDTNFDKLTSAEKLNDSEYRSFIYRTFPNEPTCGCTSTKSSTLSKIHNHNGSPVCPGCINACCRGQRCATRSQDNANDDRIPTCENQRAGDIYNGKRCFERRMRGGGCEDLYRWEENADRPGIPGRLQIPDCYGDSNTAPDYYYAERSEKLGSNCRNSGENDETCGKSPCTGVDCLIRAFRETQEFVDNLDKVPGLAALARPKASNSSVLDLPEDMEAYPEPFVQEAKPQRRMSPPVISTKPFVLPSVKRDGFSRIPPSPYAASLSGKMSIISGDGAVGPCGEACCRSRRRTHREAKLDDVKKAPRRQSKKPIRRLNIRQHQSAASQVPVDFGLRRRVHYVYLAGETYPGVNFGHKNCNDPRRRVPAKMGWLWNDNKVVGRLKPRVGWRPGAVSHTIRAIIKEVRAGALEDSRSRAKGGLRGPKSRSQTSMKRSQPKQLEVDDDAEPPPTLHILRRDGTYYVTMYPIKQERMEVPQLEEPMKPLQFKIVKDRDNCSESSSSTASDIEIEFSPPAAVNRHRRRPDVVHVDTQVKQQEIVDAFKPAVEKKKEKKGKKGKN